MAAYTRLVFSFPFERLTACRPTAHQGIEIDFYQAPMALVMIDQRVIQLLKAFEPFKQIKVCPTWETRVRVHHGSISVESEEESSFRRLIQALGGFRIPDAVFPELNAAIQAANKCFGCKHFTYGESTTQRCCRKGHTVPKGGDAKWCRSYGPAHHKSVLAARWSETSVSLTCSC